MPLMSSRWLLIFFRVERAGKIMHMGHLILGPSHPLGLCLLQPCSRIKLDAKQIFMQGSETATIEALRISHRCPTKLGLAHRLYA